jgi:hypothetical protein
MWLSSLRGNVSSNLVPWTCDHPFATRCFTPIIWQDPKHNLMDLVSVIVATHMVRLNGLNIVGILNRSNKLECPNNLAYGTRLLVGGIWHIFWMGCQFKISENILHKTFFLQDMQNKSENWDHALHATVQDNMQWHLESHNLGCLTSFDQLCHLTYCALPHQRLHLLLFTHIKMSRTLIKGASYPNNFVFVLQFFYVYESCILQFVVCVCGFFFLVVLGLHSSELASKMHFESSKVIWKHMYKKWYQTWTNSNHVHTWTNSNLKHI